MDPAQRKPTFLNVKNDKSTFLRFIPVSNMMRKSGQQAQIHAKLRKCCSCLEQILKNVRNVRKGVKHQFRRTTEES